MRKTVDLFAYKDYNTIQTKHKRMAVAMLVLFIRSTP